MAFSKNLNGCISQLVPVSLQLRQSKDNARKTRRKNKTKKKTMSETSTQDMANLEEHNVTAENHETENVCTGEETPMDAQNEPVDTQFIDRLSQEFIAYLEQYLLINLFTLSSEALWNLYLQLHVYFTSCPYPSIAMHPNYVMHPSNAMHATRDVDVEIEPDMRNEPPLLQKEQ